ncbi:MAG: hypothetical protein QF570_12090 [Myxococcota bacterium]|nr:hypothetical protein [Myxococcota bacterium]
MRGKWLRGGLTTALAVAVLFAAAVALRTAPARASETSSPPKVEPTPPHESSFAREVQLAWWRGRTCETPACRSARRGNFIDVASFGLAAAGGVLLARRRED